jgi:DnaJ-class molecular chaperone
MSTKREIQICSKCEGAGEISWDELVDYHKNDYETHTMTCAACAGTGRVVKTTAVTFEPYKPRKE